MPGAEKTAHEVGYSIDLESAESLQYSWEVQMLF